MFKTWLMESENLDHFHDIGFIKSFFIDRFNKSIISIYADFLIETGREKYGNALKYAEAREFMPPNEETPEWAKRSYYSTHKLILSEMYNHQLGEPRLYQSIHNHPWRRLGYCCIADNQDWRYGVLEPNKTCYLYDPMKSKKWKLYKNSNEIGVFSTTPRANLNNSWGERPAHPVTIKDFQDVTINEIPDRLLKIMFWKIIIYWDRRHTWGRKGSVFAALNDL